MKLARVEALAQNGHADFLRPVGHGGNLEQEEHVEAQKQDALADNICSDHPEN
jgi:hypothetical protein